MGYLGVIVIPNRKYMTMKNHNLKQILKGCRAGKAKYQKMFYEHFYGKMMSVCMRYAKDQDEARDILHEGYIKVFKYLNSYKETGSLEGWVRRIMVNTAITHYHKHKKHYQQASIENDFYEIPCTVGEAEMAVEKMAYEDVLRLVRKLPFKYRTVFNMYVIEGYNHREIGEMLNISEGTSKSNLARARKSLQAMVTQNLPLEVYA